MLTIKSQSLCNYLQVTSQKPSKTQLMHPYQQEEGKNITLTKTTSATMMTGLNFSLETPQLTNTYQSTKNEEDKTNLQ